MQHTEDKSTRRVFLKTATLGSGLLAVYGQTTCGQAETINRPELSTIIFDALNSGKKKIDIPKGNYAL